MIDLNSRPGGTTPAGSDVSVLRIVWHRLTGGDIAAGEYALMHLHIGFYFRFFSIV